MSDLQTILEKIDALTAEEKQQVVAYIQQQEQVTPQEPRKRVFGLHKGQIWMSDDFDAELPDSFWLGEE